MADVTVNIEMVDKMSRDIDGLRRKVGRFESELDNTEKQSKKTRRGLSELGRTAQFAVAAGFAAATAAAVAFAKKSIAAASSVEEMRSKFDVVFGREAPRVVEILEEFGDRVNRSRFELMEMASTLQDTFVPLGFTRKAAADLSVELTKLAVDVGSFNNAADADVIRDFQSTLVGNHETVRKYGIIITEATLKQEAYRSGIAAIGSELSAQEKVQARLNLITAGTADAQGDAAKTADSFANTMRGLEASVQELEVALGQKLLPTLKRVLPIMSGVADAATDAGSESARAAIEAGESFEEWRDEILATSTNIEKLVLGVLGLSKAEFEAVRAALEHEKSMEAFSETAFEVEDAARRAAIAAGEFAVVGRDMSTMADVAFEVRVGEEGELEATETRMGRIVGLLERMQELQTGGREAVVESVDASQFEGQEQKLASLVQGDTFTAEGTLGSSIAEGAQRIREDLNPALAETEEATGGAADTASAMFTDPLQDIKDIRDTFQGLDGETVDVFINYQTLGGGPGFQHGGQFIVPPGFQNDTFPMRVSSGERVTVEPQKNITNNFNAAPGGGNRDLLDTIKREVRRL